MVITPDDKHIYKAAKILNLDMYERLPKTPGANRNKDADMLELDADVASQYRSAAGCLT